MTMNKKPTMVSTSKELSSARPHKSPAARMIEHYHLVWLDESIDEVNNEDCHNSITKLRQVINNVNRFTDVDECIDFITDMKEEKTSTMLSGPL